MRLEVIASSVEDAVAAERGGADRIELVRDLDRQGLTPPLALVEAVVAAVSIPVRVMLRERDGFGVSGAAEIERLRRAARALAALPIDGLVLGWLDEAGEADLPLTARVLECAGSHRATFHRAFDATPDPWRTLDRLAAEPRIDRVLTSGGAGDWDERRRCLERYQAHAPGLTILVGGGVDAEAYRRLRASPRLREAHVGRAVRVLATTGGAVAASRVRALVGHRPGSW